MNEEKYLRLTCNEMKNMLSIISGYAEFINSGMVESGEALELAGKIQHMTSNVSRFIDNKYLYETIKKDIYEINKEEYDIREIYKEAKKALEDYGFHSFGKYKENIVMDVKGNTKPVDKYLIRVLMQKLLVNALYYRKNDTEIRVDIHQTDQKLQIRIQNKASAITKENMKHIEEPLYRINRNESREKGSYGFGIPIARGIVRMHQGNIRFTYKSGVFEVNVEI